MDNVILAQYISAKISHDLSGVCGALNQAIEFLNDGNKKVREQAQELLHNGVFEMTIRLKMLREIYGASYTPNETADLVKIKNLIKEYFSKKKVHLDWRLDPDSQNISCSLAKIILALSVIASNKLIYGGSTIVQLSSSSPLEVAISAIGNNLAFNEQHTLYLNDNNSIDVSVANVEIIYLKSLAASLGFKISALHDENKIKYSITQL